MSPNFNHINADEQLVLGSVTTRLLADGAITTAKLDINANVDFNEFQALDFRIQNLTSFPSIGNVGRLIWRSDLNDLYVDTGAAWTSVSVGGAVSSIHSDSNPLLIGAVQFVSGTGITLSQVGQAITINSTATVAPGGSDGNIQFNSSGTFGGNANVNVLQLDPGQVELDVIGSIFVVSGTFGNPSIDLQSANLTKLTAMTFNEGLNYTVFQTSGVDGWKFIGSGTFTNPILDIKTGTAQIGIGTPTPNASAILDITSTTTGLLLPRLTTIQRNAISSPATGLEIFNTDTIEFEFWNGSAWTGIGGGLPGGSNTQLQYNNAGSFAGAPGLTTDGTNLTIGGVILNAVVPGDTSIDPNQAQLLDTAGPPNFKSLDWGNRELFDSTGTTPALNWNSRQLVGPTSGDTLDWSVDSQITINGTVLAANGSGGNPAYSFTADPTLGMWLNGPGALVIQSPNGSYLFDGSGFNLQGNPIVNVPDPINPQDAATKNYVDSHTIVLVTREIPSGVIDGANVTFTLAFTPVLGSEMVFLNGLLNESGAGNDYTISGAIITYLSAPQPGDRILVSYQK